MDVGVIQSAVRCKMAYKDPTEVCSSWQSSKSTPSTSTSTSNYQYWLYPQLAELTKRPVFITSPIWLHEDAQAYFWNQGSCMYLTFRGTSSFADILSDVDIFPISLPEGRGHGHDNVRVHSGFWHQYTSIETELEKRIHDIIHELYESDPNTEFKLFISGHSLGGAIAQIATVCLADTFPSLAIICHTFGSPRVGNKAFVKWVSASAFEYVRVANKNDPIPMFPQLPLWSHCCRKCFVIDDDLKTHDKSKDVPWYLRTCQTFEDIDFKAPIQDHSCNLYIDRLNTIVRRRRE